jgi:two-component system chemotaxis response regulator CheB
VTDALRVLVVDDSAVVRQAMQAILGAASMEVTVAADPLIAMAKMSQVRPDVIVLDLEMPRMHGRSFLRKLMAEDPIPVVICSGRAGTGTDAALGAMDDGAVAIVLKPQLGVQGFLRESSTMIVDTVRAAAAARVRLRGLAPSPRAPNETATVRRPAAAPPAGSTSILVAIGASTGGTEALGEILHAMPADGPAIALVQHMPEGFTRAFAERLDKACRIHVKEAEDGDLVLPGRALVAPGNRHMAVARASLGWVVQVGEGPLVSRHRPSVDVLFRSVASTAGARAVGVILTGMGADGAEGLGDMRRAGARTIAQDEATSIVFGMPREAIARGAADEIVPLGQIPAAVLRAVQAVSPHRRFVRGGAEE